MLVVMPWQKTCPDCHVYLEPDVYANCEIDPHKVGNPWHCPKCNKPYVYKSGTYAEHIEMIREHYMGDNETKKVERESELL
jgi:hypothetical protein